MRIWSIHPKYLDTKGLVAAWREGLLAQNVLMGKTRGYKNHPQLVRFKNCDDSLQLIANYLHTLCDEAECRDYKFSRDKICKGFCSEQQINLTSGQLDYEWQHFISKIKQRDPNRFESLTDTENISQNPIFKIIPGKIECWEVIKQPCL